MAVTPFRERVECALPPRMMYALATQDVFVFTNEEKGKRDFRKFKALLKTACMEPLDGLPPRIAITLAKQIDRIHGDVMDEYDQQRADKVAAAIYYFIKEITDNGYMDLWEGSPLAEAATMFLGMIEHVFEESSLDSSAMKQARRILRKLNAKGYYLIEQMEGSDERSAE